jgi:DNA polymerase III delta subunit
MSPETTMVPHVHIFSGSDIVGKEAVRQKALGAVETAAGACVKELYDPSTESFSDFLQKIITPTLFGDTRIFTVNHAEKLSERELDALGRILDDVPDDVYLFIDCADAGKRSTGKNAPVGRLKAKKRADEMPERFVYRDFQSPPEYKVGQWLSENVPGLCGRTIHPDAVERLIDLAGRDTATLFSEIRKIDIHLDEGRAIDRASVETVVGASRQMTAFELAAACSSRQSVRVMEVIDSLFSTTCSVPMIIGVLYRHYAALLRIRHFGRAHPREVKLLLGKGGGFQAKNEAAFRLGCAAGLLHEGEERKVYPVIIASGIVMQAQQFTDEELWRILAWLLDFDVAVKTGGSTGSRREVELLCFRLLRVSQLATGEPA